jgi:predicted ribosome quality control (RQC) complex YloA/Tae2 family protein
MQTPAARGLNAAELALASERLRLLCPASVMDAVAITGTGSHDDILLVVQPKARTNKSFVHIALGGQRARITTTSRRFGKSARAQGPNADSLLRELKGASLTDVVATEGERRCSLLFDTAKGQRILFVELFGARGLWVLCDAENVALTISRPVQTAVRTLRRGDTYHPPPPAPSMQALPSGSLRFSDPVLEQIDSHFTPLDIEKEQTQTEDALLLAIERGRKKAKNKIAGMQRQLEDVSRSHQLRTKADMMLAYAHEVTRGATSMTIPGMDNEGATTIELDPRKTVAQQANQLYDKARRLEDGKAITEQRLAAATAELEELQTIEQLLQSPTEERVELARVNLQKLGLITKPQPTTRPNGKKKTTPSSPFRRFLSAEGYPIFVGRNNNQNDELTMRFANGNDLWLHVGGGRPGSHVVVRLPKQKTASLETLLDAATLAVYYSKSRGEPRIDVIYTHRKNVKKPKGLPPGAVVPSQTKSITTIADPQRLARLLDSSATSDD